MNPGESAQAVIYFAVVAMAMLLTLGLAVEGGRVFVTYRQMQTAADMAALVGAQDLPTRPDSAAADACSNAQKNGFGTSTCTSSPPSAASGGSSAVAACVPPASKTPYDVKIANYGGSTSGCSTPTSSIYIEVQIAYNIGTIPIFNVPVTLYSHAVARNGIPDVTDYAVVAMNSTPSISGGGLKMGGGNGIVVVGSTFVNTTDSGAIVTPGGGHELMCHGQWLNSANEPLGSLSLFNVDSAILSPGYAPPGCKDTNGNLVTTSSPVCPNASPCATAASSGSTYVSNAGKISDPYGDTDCPDAKPASETNVGFESCPPSPIPASASGTNLENSCSLCMQTAYYLDRKNKKWLQADASGPQISGNDIIELFPGVYPGGITMSGGSVYMNPGVYILGGDFKSTGGTLCVFGAPDCDVVTSGTGSGGAWDYLSTQTSNSNKNAIPFYLTTSAKWSTANCSSAVFSPTTDPAYVDPRTWFYYCSPWGFWDPNIANENVTCSVTGCSGATGHPTVLVNADPVFVKQDGSASSVKMNGVTVYMRSGNVKITGNAGQSLAMPNPCYGSGTGTAGSIPSAPTTASPGGVVDFPDGSNALTYPYPSTSLANLSGVAGTTGLASTSSPSGAILYPNGDMEKSCQDSAGATLNLEVWNNEFSSRSYPLGQHLHFLFFAKNSNSPIELHGGGSQNWWGIVHTWPFQTTGSFPGPPDSTEGYPADKVTVIGSAGGGGGPPMLIGQVIGDNIEFGGSSLVEVFNRPGGRPSAPGVGLVQ